MNKTWRREGGGDEAENILINYLRNHELAGTWNSQQKALYRTTWDEYLGGYGINVFSCAAVKSDNYSPAGKLIVGPTTLNLKFDEITDKNLVATIVLISPRLLRMSVKLEEDGSYTAQTSVTDNY